MCGCHCTSSIEVPDKRSVCVYICVCVCVCVCAQVMLEVLTHPNLVVQTEEQVGHTHTHTDTHTCRQTHTALIRCTGNLGTATQTSVHPTWS